MSEIPPIPFALHTDSTGPGDPWLHEGRPAVSRRERWWRPTTTRRPGQRARARRLYTDRELVRAGCASGYADGLERCRQSDEQLRRLAEACEEGPDAVTELAREVGVMPTEQPADEVGFIADIERYLREQD